jgi:hypothetical protein
MSSAQILTQSICCSGRRSSVSSTIITNLRVVKLRIQITRSLMYEFLKFPHSHTARPISLSLRRVFCSVRVFWWIVYTDRRLVPDRQGASGRSSEARGKSDMKMCGTVLRIAIGLWCNNVLLYCVLLLVCGITMCCTAYCYWFVVQQWGKVIQVWQQSVQLSAVCAPAGTVSNLSTVCTHTY